MSRTRRLIHVFFALAVLLGLNGGGQVFAAEPAPKRQAAIVVPYTQYEWWVIRWSDNSWLCQVLTDHESLPTSDDILKSCGGPIHAEWKTTPACSAVSEENGDTSKCLGVYLYLINNKPAEKTILVDLPAPEVWVEITGCSPTTPENLCSTIPSLRLTGEEPLPNEQITAIRATLGGQVYLCDAATCDIPLQPTLLEGETVEFWAESSFGDSSKHFTALVRVIDSGVTQTPSAGGWYVDVLSTQWRGKEIASCAQTWQAFPPVGGPPAWLTTPEVPALMATDEPYHYLAGRLIAQGLVDASACAGGGLLANGYADACGLEAALPLVQEWQDQFDAQIIAVAQETGVPAQLMKNLFAVESQFWPGAFKDPKEFGLGQMTENGADALLLWNPTFYEQFCPLVLDASVCENGYTHLDSTTQATLRGALSLEAKVDCEDCPAGIDLSNANFSINLFAQSLLANCEQVGQVVYNATNLTLMPGEVTDYESLWRFTIANYHAGPGCLSYAMYSAWQAGAAMDWEHVSTYLTDPCKGVISYVDKIAR